MLKGLARDVSAGLIIGLSAIIYAISHAALLFSGVLSPGMPYGLTVTLLTAAAGGLYGLLSEEPTFVVATDSNVSSVIAALMAGMAGASIPGVSPLHAGMIGLVAASITLGLTFLAVAQFGLARLIRFFPFPVMAGFLASTGWLMTSGSLNIMAHTPLTLATLQSLARNPMHPELLVGIGFMFLLGWLIRRLGAALAIPAFISVASVAINLLVRWGCPQAGVCAVDRWFFEPFDHLEWLAPWNLHFSSDALLELGHHLPGVIAVAFVGTLTLLLSLSSLERPYQRDFKLEPALQLHGALALMLAAIGGYPPVLSIGRSLVARQIGAGRWSGLVVTLVCMAMLLGLGWTIAWIPRVAVGALVLHVGIGMLRNWVWAQRGEVTRLDMLQIVSILAGVILFGYVVGMLAGLVASLLFFVVNYARMPHIRLDTTLASLRSSVIRDAGDQKYLAEAGNGCRIGRFEGFVFFGVANSIYEWYRAGLAQGHSVLVLDFSTVRGIDQSAVQVIQKIVHNETANQRKLVLAVGSATQALVRTMNPAAGTIHRPGIASSFDTAVEQAEEFLLAQRSESALSAAQQPLAFFESAQDQGDFVGFLSEVELQTGGTLFHEGQASDEIYFVETGRLEIVKNVAGATPIRLAKIVAGSMIGEMAMYSRQPRSATAVALEPVSLRVLSRAAWERMKQARPDLAARFDHHVIVSLTNTVGRANSALSLLRG